MDKKIRKAVRTFLTREDKVIVTKYKTELNKDYYDIPGGKIEENETSIDASIREFKEETGIDIIKQTYIGKVVIEYPTKIFEFDVFKVDEYNGEPLEFEENSSMWIDIKELLNKNKKIPSVEILKFLHLNNLNLKIEVDENHNILNISM